MLRFLVGLALIVSASTLRAQDMPLSQVLIEGESWSLASKGYDSIHALQGFTTGLVAVRHSKGEKLIDNEIATIDRLQYDSEGRSEPLTFGHGFGYGVSRI